MISTILIFALAFLSLIILMVIHEFGHFIIAKKFGVKVEEFGIGYPPRVYGKKIGETIYSINLLPLGAFVKIYGEEGGVEDYRSFTSLKIWQRILIVIGGVAAFWLAAIVIFSIVFGMGAKLPVGDSDVSGLAAPEVKVIAVAANSPASESGLISGDTLLRIEGSAQEIVEINKVKDFQDFVKNHAGEQIKILAERNGEAVEAVLTPRVSPPAGQGAVGISLERMATLIQKTPWYLAPLRGAVYTWETTVNALKGLYIVFSDLLSGKGAPAGAEFAGPIGITVFLANAASFGVGFFLYFIGLIAVFIAIFNLFPIPALDGGKLVFLLIEKARGKPVSEKIEQGITVTFFMILVALSLFITIRFDIPRLINFFQAAL